ncbi:non-ribosomal peptide synthetase [Comamonas sp. JC664]|uniref:non-ribosomal peptide synthetase n=1 Tax=Comamonas sp. JC664 TaxID=2801917 RepID=UPI00174D2CAA|nr:non-ribosomal peptide synthetase [Comamonas sp. JC664]MBL0696446.1 amino acid adenylation domain-containing protein [Comamonas sp. JC664]GHG84274.1 non-ribosomal peptide synthetase [Comamonas sp. KCTC 72670]
MTAESFVFPVSFAQQRLWFLHLMQPENPSYHIAGAVRLAGTLEASALQRAFDALVERHESLRTTFAQEAGQPVQVVAPEGTASFVVTDLGALPQAAREAEARRLATEEIRQPFDLMKGPLLRTRLLRLGETDHVLVLTMHHIISDGASLGILIHEMSQLYGAFIAQREPELPELPIQYADYTEWQREWMATEGALDAHVAYWKQQLAGAPVLQLPTDRPRPAVQTQRGDAVSLHLPAALVAELQKVGQRENATLFMTILAAFQALLSRYTHQTDILVGAPQNSRSRVQTEGLIGFFVNTLVLRADLSGNPTFRELLKRVREATLGAYAHQDIPFEKLVEAVQPTRNLAYTPLFQAAFNFQGMAGPGLTLPGVTLQQLDLPPGTSKFDVTLDLQETADGLRGFIEYNSDLFDRETLERFTGHFQTLLAGVAANAELRLDALPLLTQPERRQLLDVWPALKAFPGEDTLHGRFEAQVRQHPDAIAVVADGERLTYAELDRRANQLAHALLARGVHREALVGLCVERSLATVVGILGILKAGAAYVPLDPTYPADRLAFMVSDSRMPLVVTQRHLLERLPSEGAALMVLDDVADELARQPSHTPGLSATREQLAYVIYTSGSTGLPKGSLLPHGNVMRLFDATEHWFHFDANDAWTLFHSYAFDFSVWELWGALLHGGKLVVVPYLVSRSPEAFFRLLSDERVTVLNQTPAAFRQLIQAEERLGAEAPPLSLRYVVFGGEALEPATLVPWFRKHGDTQPRLINMYGITETTVHVTYRPMDAAEAERTQQSPIGVAIPDLQLYVLDARMEPAPIGVAGEIFVGGAGLARGYLGRPGLTAERFVPHPFSHEPGARLYRTGDLARFTKDGQLEYLGRIDHQVKIRGFRIELGEIQTVLSLHPSVREALVLVRESAPGNKSLVAYVATAEQPAPSVNDLRQHLLSKLPDYMVPSAFVMMERFPLTANGKVDRKALPEPESARADLADAYVAPRTKVEEALCAIWSEVLEVPRVGIHDNFFALGGDSILSIQVLTLAQKQDIRFSLQQLFQHQTVAELAAAAGEAQPPREVFPRTEPFSLISTEDRAKLPEGIEDAYPLARIQAGMLFHMELAPTSNIYHNTDSFHLRLKTPFNAAHFDEAVQVVTARQPVLRTAFDMTSYSEPLQLVHRHAHLSLEVTDVRHLSTEAQDATIRQLLEDEKRQHFDLACPPLLRFFVHIRGERDFQFTLTECHAIIDGWSLHSTLVEIFNHYYALVNHQEPPRFEPLSITYRDFVAMERQALASEAHQRYWSEFLADGQVMRVPRWRRALAEGEPRIATFKVPIPPALTEGLNALTRTAGVPLKSILLASHLKVMSVLSGQEDVITGTGVNSRPEEGDGAKLRGIFLNTVPFRMKLAPGSWLSLVRTAFDTERALYPFRRYPMADIQRQWGRETLYEVMFNYMHFHVLHDLAGTLAEMEALSTIRSEGTNVTLAVHFQTEPHTQEITLELDYNAVELEAAQVEQIGACFSRVLHALAFESDAPHHTSSPLPADVQHQLLTEWNATAAALPAEPTFQALFEARAASTPEAIAVVDGERTLTYRELDASANRLAHHLLSLGAGPERVVALGLDRSIELVTGLLATLKAGAAYLPLDPSYPAERLAYMLSDSRAVVLVTTQAHEATFAASAAPRFLLDQEAPRLEALPSRPLTSSATRDSLAYVIYTSGSTGLPKGTLLTQRGLLNYLSWAQAAYAVKPGQGSLVHTSIAFDATITSLLTPLLAGGTVHLVPAGREVEALALALQQPSGHELVKLTPAHLQVLSGLIPPEALSRLTGTFVVGGEALPPATVAFWRQHAPQVRLINEYGPTETVVGCSVFDVSAGELPDGIVPIGRPIANTALYVLDARMQPVPVGVTGELYIGGTGVARGYLGRPALSAERFVPNPFSQHPGKRLYRTGDHARFLPDGNLEFLGRRDGQVKLRGYRIELGEVEATVRQHAAVSDAVVIVREDVPGDQRLAAYVVPHAEAAVDTASLRAFLQQRLPEHMVPSALVAMEALPLTPNGKVDRKALPVPDGLLSAEARAAPRNGTEELIASIWVDVLRTNHAGIHDHFFDLGGHSLLATRVVSRIREAFGVELPIAALFEAPTIATLAERVQALQAQQAGEPPAPPLRAFPRDGELPLSFAQQRLWFLYQMEPDSPFYNMPAVIRLTGVLNVDAVQRCLEALIHRHESLRTTFRMNGQTPVQVIQSPSTPKVDIADLRSLAPELREAEARRLSDEEARRPFDLTRGPLCRMGLIQLADQEHLLLLTLHHIIADGWSLSVLVREVAEVYGALSAGQPSPLSALPVQYADYARWQREWLAGPVLERQLDYWKQRLTGAPSHLDLPTDRPRPPVQSFRGATHQGLLLPADAAKALQALCRRESVTPFMAVMAAFQALMHRYTGETDIVVGTDIANRNRAGTEGLIGFFVNQLVMRGDLSGDPSFRSLLSQTRRVALDAYAHQDLPFEELVKALNPERDLSYSPLFQVKLILQNAPSSDLQLEGLTLSEETSTTGAAKFDMTWVATETERGMECLCEYSTDLFDAATIDRMMGNLRELLLAAIAQPELCVSRLALLSTAEREQTLVAWNDTATPRAGNPCAHHLFEQQAARTPDAVAVSFEGEQLTYRELDARANQLAWHLKASGVGPEVRVGLCVDRSLELVVGILGILKAGGAWLPLDPSYPVERLTLMMRDAAIPVLVTQEHLADELPALGLLVCLDADWPMIARQPQTPPTVEMSEDHLAYIIFTSGSTGRPKGTLLTHRGLCNTALAAIQAHRVHAQSRVLQFAALGFDASVCEVFSTLLAGAQLCLAPRDAIMPGAPLQGLLASQRITGVTLTPSVLAQLEPEALPLLESVVSAGEACSPELARRWLKATRFINAYGPTETTICASVDEAVNPDRLSIGRAWANVRLYVLDAGMQPLPVGVPGELFIGGVGVARGYLGRPDLSAERFVPDPFSATPGERLYRTGDRVRWLPEGRLEFLGRLDHQVKLRGFRIELGEIEAALAAHPEVQDAAVLVREEAPGRKQLVAYVVPDDDDQPVEADALRKALEGRLPDYMVPSAFVMLKAMPLTTSGKVDRKALPSLAQQQAKPEHVHVAPRNPVEQTLADIWSKVLSRERVSIHDNFFELGGDSIVSIQVIARALEAGLHISPRQFFQYQTIAALAPHVGQAQVVESEQGPVTGAVPLTPIQHWFFEWDLPQLHHYNQALLLGLRQPITAAVLQDALRALVAHHDALRLRFERTADGWRQESLGPDSTVTLREVDLSTLDEAAQRAALEQEAQRAQAGFKLDEAPLVSAVRFHLGPQRGDRLLFAIHHLAVDAVSWRVLLADLETACQQLLQGQPVALPPKTTSFQAWARRLEEYAASPALDIEADHWFQAGEDTAPLPVDAQGGENTLESARTLTVALEAEETRLLLQEAPTAWRARIDEVLLTALAQALSTWTGQRRLRVQLEGHGREDLFDGVDLSRTVGWFTSTYPVTLALPKDGSVGDELRAVRDGLRRVPNKGVGYGIVRYLRQDERGARLRTQAEAPVSFNYLGQLDSALPTSSLLAPADEPFGAQQGTQGRRRQVLEVNAHVFGGKLEVSFTYSEALHQRTTVGALAQGYLHALRGLVEQRRGAEAARFSPADFPLAKVSQATLNGLMQSHPDMEDLYPLSPMQQGMLFHALLDPNSGMYFERAAWTLDTDLNREALREAWQQVMARYPILRTSFVGEELEAPLQLVNRTATLPWDEQDWSHLPEAEQQSRLSAWMDADRAKGFDLKQAPLMRVGALKLGAKTWRVVWSFHHLLLDGWSVGRVLNEMLAMYDAQVRKQPLRLEPPPVYRDYIAWLEGRGIAQAETWWKQALRGFGEPTPLPGETGGQARNAAQVMGERKVHLSAETTEQLRAFSRRHQVTLSTLVQAAWALVLGRHAGLEDVVFGVTVAGRPPELPGVEQMVGLFINTLPARVSLPAQRKVVDWLKELQAWQVDRAPFEYAPLVKVQGWSPVPRGTPLFESLVVFENYPVEDSVRQGAGVLEVRDVTAQERTNYPLTLSAHADKQLMLNLDFESPRLGVEAMERVLEQLQTVLVGILDAEDKHLWELSLLTKEGLREVVYDWNDTHVPAQGACLHELFEAQAKRTPDAVAVTAPEAGSLTYAQLDARANQLAHHLRARGIGPELLVGVCLERTPDLLVALMGILKAGGAYVPLDPTYPAERLARMATEARLSLLLTQQSLVETFANPEVALYLLDTEAPARADLPTQAPSRLTSPDGLAYVVFTSGSTGTPKGVMISHRSWSNAYLGWARSYGLRDHCQSHLQMASFSFDVFAGDLSRALCSGGKLVLCPREWLLEPPRLLALMREERVDCAEFVPAVLRGLLQHLEETGQSLDFMRVLVAGSDAWYVNEYHRLQAVIGDDTRLINSYGVSEATIDSTWFESGELGPGDTQLVPIGRPFANNRLHVLDAHGQPVPAGIAGELFIGGLGVARGYCNRPDLTAERFVPDPFSTEPGARLYRTGDRARYLLSGDLEFLGRADTQVKLRGFRVELGEIESALGKHPSVQGAVVLLREDPGAPRRLVAYVVGPDLGDTSVLRDHLRERLPDYMVPAVFVRLEAIPLSPNGKVDRKAFPAPDAAQRTGEQRLVEPRSETEASLLALWKDVLGQTSLGVTDDFFDVGGHSLLATQIISRTNAMFQVKVPLRALFEQPTIAGLAEQVVLAQLANVDEAALASALEEVGDLSDADLETLLEGSNE